MKPSGNSNIERILAICGVILLHYNGGACNALAAVNEGSLNH